MNGYVVRGRGEYSSVSIFLPCAGCGYDAATSLYGSGSHGFYWSSVTFSDYYGVSELDFGSDYCHVVPYAVAT